MAALLCQSLCNLLTEFSECLLYPCQPWCSAAYQMLCSPFTPYLAVTLAFNIPLVHWGVETLTSKYAFCEKVWWLWCNAIMGMVHIVGSCYIVYRIQEVKRHCNSMKEEVYYKQHHDEVQTNFPPHPKEDPQCHHHIHIAGFSLNDSGFIEDDVSLLEGGDATKAVANINTNKNEIIHSNLVMINDLKRPIQQTPPPYEYYTPSTTGADIKSLSLVRPQSAASKPMSPFRHMFSHWKDPSPCKQEAMPHTIVSVASLVARLPDEDDHENTLQRIGKVLCYDPGTAMYLFVAVLWVIWQCTGVVIAMSLARNNGTYVHQCDNVKEWIELSTICGFLYMMFVLFAFSCSLLCLR